MVGLRIDDVDTIRRMLNIASLLVSERDRQALKLLMVFGMALLFYSTVILPVYNYYQDNRKLLKDNRELLLWVLENGDDARMSSDRSRQQYSTETLIQSVTSAAHSLNLKRVRSEGDHIRVWIDQAGLTDVLEWLIALERIHDVYVVQITLEQGDVAGMVKVQVDLK